MKTWTIIKGAGASGETRRGTTPERRGAGDERAAREKKELRRRKRGGEKETQIKL